MPQAAYAALRNVSKQYIGKLIDQGKLVPPAVTADRQIVIAEADRQLLAQRDPSKGRHGRPAEPSAGEQPMLTLTSEPMPHAQSGDGPAHGTLAHAKLVTAQRQAEITEWQLRKLKDELVDKAAAERAVKLATGACVEVLGRLGDEVITALRGAVTMEDAHTAWKALRAGAQQAMIAEVTRAFREAMADA